MSSVVDDVLSNAQAALYCAQVLLALDISTLWPDDELVAEPLCKQADQGLAQRRPARRKLREIS